MPENQPPLRRIHTDAVLEGPLYRASLEFWRGQTTQTIVASLRPGQRNELKTFPDGRVKDGNTRIKVLEERGYDLSSLPRQVT